MSTWSDHPHARVDGDDICQSRGYFLGALALLSAGILIFGYAFVHTLGFYGQGGRKDPGVLGLAIMVVGPFVLLYVIARMVRLWRRNQRLRIGADRLQLLEHDGEVKGEILYCNVAALAVKEQPRSAPLLMIRLQDPLRTDWFWPQPAGFREFLRSAHNCDVLLMHETGFSGSSYEIERKIRCRWEEYRSQLPATAVVNNP